MHLRYAVVRRALGHGSVDAPGLGLPVIEPERWPNLRSTHGSTSTLKWAHVNRQLHLCNELLGVLPNNRQVLSAARRSAIAWIVIKLPSIYRASRP